MANIGTGKGGKSFQDRQLAAEVRTLTLEKIKALFTMPRVDMNDHDAQLHDRVLERLAGTVLPRINEVTGEDGGPIELNMNAITFKKFKNEGKRGSASK
jgi:hypothetical protein